MRLVLPFCQAIIAVLLSFLGNAQARMALHGQVVWDYFPPAEILLHAINYPAAIATGLTLLHGSFQIGLRYSCVSFVVYLVYIFLLWCAISWFIEQGWPRSDAVRRASLLMIPGGLLFGSVLLLVAFWMLHGPHGGILILSAFLWSGLVLVFFTIAFVRRYLYGR